MINFLRNGFTNETLLVIICFLFSILISLSFHEFAHAYVANNIGDDTAKRLGRLTLNPLAHLDLLGTISFVLFGFGWAKPVPINPLNFKEYRKGLFLTSIAGIVANVFLAFFASGAYVLMLKLNALASTEFLAFVTTFLVIFFEEMIYINLGLAVFNLLPIFPLDGFNIISSLTRSGNGFQKFMMKYGSIILLVMFLTGFFDIALTFIVEKIMYPFVAFWGFVGIL